MSIYDIFVVGGIGVLVYLYFEAIGAAQNAIIEVIVLKVLSANAREELCKHRHENA